MFGHVKSAWIVLALSLFFPVVFAQVAVSVDPVLPIHESGLFENESALYRVLVINVGNERLVGLHFRALVSQGVVLLENNVEVRSQEQLVSELLPGQSVEWILNLKGVQGQSEGILSVNLGENQFETVFARRILVSPSPLFVSTRVLNIVLRQGQAAKVRMDFRNDSDHSLFEIQSELAVSHREDATTRPLFVPELVPNQTVENILFEFLPKPLATGKHELAVRTSFVDQNAVRVLHHRIEVEVEESSRPLIWFVVLLVLVVVGYLALKNAWQKPPLVKQKSKVTVPTLPEEAVEDEEPALPAERETDSDDFQDELEEEK